MMMAAIKLRQLFLAFTYCSIPFLSMGTHGFAVAQTIAPDTLNKKKLYWLAGTTTLGYTAAMVGLNEVWYKSFDRQSFAFFNDSKEWLQMDKVGHVYSAFHLSDATSRALQWTGLPKKKSDRIGTITSFVMMSSIEVFDGYSSGYGASSSDLLANALGGFIFLGQQALWNETRIHPKFSFHTTYLANQRPDVLGRNYSEKLLKDYNGQTYWLSVDMDEFMPFPEWLNLAVGYGGHNMVFATEGANLANGYAPYRQLYLSLDFDTKSIRTKSRTLKTILYLVNLIKLPSPTLEFSNGSIKTHAFYF